MARLIGELVVRAAAIGLGGAALLLPVFSLLS